MTARVRLTNCLSSIMGNMPSATHSPWYRPLVRRPRMPFTASMPWPMVWPKLRQARMPVSRSSCSTTRFFTCKLR